MLLGLLVWRVPVCVGRGRLEEGAEDELGDAAAQGEGGLLRAQERRVVVDEEEGEEEGDEG